MNNLYPIYVKLKNKVCVVVGGGSIAFRKIQALLRAEADVTLISPELNNDLLNLVDQSKINYLNRKFQQGDLDNAFLVVAATNDSSVNLQIWNEANTRNILINVVDVPSLCNFYVPSVVRDGDLALAISTNGKAPYLSKLLRLKFENYLSPFNFKKLIDRIYHKRQELKALYPNDIQKRETQIKEFIDDSFKQIINH